MGRSTTMRMKMIFDMNGLCLLDRVFGYMYATDKNDVGMRSILRTLGFG